MVLITIVTGAYKPTYNWGPHIVYEWGYDDTKIDGCICSNYFLDA